MLSGIVLRNKETTVFEATRTAVVAIPIPIPFFTEVLTAKTGHIPKSIIKTGFSFTRPFVNSLNKPLNFIQPRFI